MFFYQLFRPVAYLTIKHTNKYLFDWVAPIFLSIASLCLVIVGDGQIKLFGSNSVVSLILSFISMLPGFYIAALAAIATFNRHDIDRPMPKPTPTIKIRLGDHSNTIDLSRRRFLSILFAFLTFESIVVGIISIILFLSENIIEKHLSIQVGYMIFFFYIMMFWQLVTSTMLSLYYLGDKIHQPDQ